MKLREKNYRFRLLFWGRKVEEFLHQANEERKPIKPVKKRRKIRPQRTVNESFLKGKGELIICKSRSRLSLASKLREEQGTTQ